MFLAKQKTFFLILFSDHNKVVVDTIQAEFMHIEIMLHAALALHRNRKLHKIILIKYITYIDNNIYIIH